jgi:hypothetical protein
MSGCAPIIVWDSPQVAVRTPPSPTLASSVSKGSFVGVCRPGHPGRAEPGSSSPRRKHSGPRACPPSAALAATCLGRLPHPRVRPTVGSYQLDALARNHDDNQRRLSRNSLPCPAAPGVPQGWWTVRVAGAAPRLPRVPGRLQAAQDRTKSLTALARLPFVMALKPRRKT